MNQAQESKFSRTLQKTRNVIGLWAAPVILVAATFGSTAHAAGVGLTNLSQADFDNAIRELSANSTFHAATGASALGSIFGFEIGLVGGLTNTPEINRLSKQVDASADIGRLPHASLLAAVTVPMGFTAEALLLPSVSVGDIKYQQFGGAVKWSTSPDLLPFNLAVRGFLTRNEVSFTQLQSGSTITVTQENSQYGLQLLASPMLPFIEPYVGIGTVAAKGKMSYTGSSSIFAFTTAQSAESSPSSTQFLVGVNANLLIMNIGAEYSRAFSTDSYNLKLGFRF